MEPEKLMESISDELTSTLKALAKAQTVEEKVQLSIVVKNLSESFGIFIKMVTDMMPFEEYEDD